MTSGLNSPARAEVTPKVNKVLEGDDEMDGELCHACARASAEMKRTGAAAECRRNENGPSNFDLTETVIEVREEQAHDEHHGAANATIAHRIIEEFRWPPIAPSNRYSCRRGIESLHRVHEKTDARKVPGVRRVGPRLVTIWGRRELHSARSLFAMARVSSGRQKPEPRFLRPWP